MGPEPEYGVLALWTHGHLIEYVARRPSIANNFGDDLGETNFLASYRYFDAPVEEATELTTALRVRYVLMRTATGAERDALAPESMRFLLSGTPEEVAGIAGVRLVYDEPMRLPNDAGRVRIFEIR
jgi:asparagine N-glycosylation enzyme membrane subunit Stt3